MHFLRREAERVEGLFKFIDAVSEYSITQGVVLDLNPFWVLAYRLAAAGLESNRLLWELVNHPYHFASRAALLFDVWEIGGPGEYVDLTWNAEVVQLANERFFDRSFGQNSPFLVRVATFPLREGADRLTFDEGRQRSAVVALAREAPFAAVVETRSPAAFSVAPGDKCKPATGGLGTIGGFVEDTSTGRVYAVTCGHVVTSGRVSVKRSVIGYCTHAHAPQAHASNVHCTRNSPGERLDIALIELGARNVRNSTTAVAGTIYSGEPISMAGGVSGRHMYEIGGAAMTYQIGGTCWKDLFEVRPPAPAAGIISPRLKCLIATVPTLGDSGAWIERQGTSEWCGMLVASDSTMGYALESDVIVVEANAEFRMNLRHL